MDHDHNHPETPDEGCSMSMLFHSGHCETILFSSWEAKQIGTFIGATIGIFLFAYFYEFLKYYRDALYEQELIARSKCQENPRLTFKDSLTNRFHLIQTLLHLLQVTASYLLMLIFMTFNYYLCLAIVLGATAGFFSFGWIRRSTFDSNECCY